jgi:hypothetical protein
MLCTGEVIPLEGCTTYNNTRTGQSTTTHLLLDMPTSPTSALAFRSRTSTPPQYAFHHSSQTLPYPQSTHFRRESPKSDHYLAPNAAALYSHAQMIAVTTPSPPVTLNNDAAGPVTSAISPGPQSAALSNHYATPSAGVTRLPPILGVEKQQVTTSATQMASASRRRNEAHFQCPVPGCGSTFTRRFNLRGMYLCCHPLL